MKALFVPLKKEHFLAFESGEKTHEYRMEGPRWNTKTCFPGRSVVLSLGYGKKRRLNRVIKSVEIRPGFSHPAFVQCYGRSGRAIDIEMGNI